MHHSSFIPSVMVVAFALLVASMGMAPVGAMPLSVPVDPDYFDEAPHALVGSWSASNEVGAITFTFNADGSLTLDYPLAGAGTDWAVFSYGPATGTWEAVGERGLRFSAVQSIAHVQGTDVGTITIDGYAVPGPGGLAAPATEISAIVTYRDTENNITSMSSIGGDSPSLSATRPHAAVPTGRGGCTTCR